MKKITVDINCTEPLFKEESLILLENLKKYTPWELESVLKTNGKIADKAFGDILEFDNMEQGTPAMFAYDGLVYRYLDPLRLSEPAVERAQSSMRIISAFYGLLRPLDGILPYRLEMRSGLSVNGENMYNFWSGKLYNSLFSNECCIVNLASEEYAGIIRKYLKSTDSFVDVIFQSVVRGQRKTITTTVKMARGQMARYILENSIDDPESLKGFKGDGFTYEESLSSRNRYVFLTKG